MAKKTNYILIAGIAAVAYFLYRKSTSQAQPVAMLPGAGLNPTLPTTNLLQPQPVVVQAPAPAPVSVQSAQAQVVSIPAPTSGTSIPADIYTWVGSLDAANQAQANKALAIMPQSEIDSLEDIVHNDFYGNGITTTAQRTFWNMWRVKYHVLDNTYA